MTLRSSAIVSAILLILSSFLVYYFSFDSQAHVLSCTGNYYLTDSQVYDLAQGEGVPVIREFYAMPQTLIAGQQKITLVVDIQTYRKMAGETDFTPALLQNDVTVSADLLIDTGDANTSVFAWEMNQAITYDITLGPAGRQITFDPAVANWDYKTYATNIDLNI